MEHNRGFIATSKRLFLRGLVALLPTLVTLIILIKLVTFIDANFGRYIATGLTHALGATSKQLFRPTAKQLDAYLAERGISTSTFGKEAYEQREQQAIQELRQANMDDVANGWQMAVLGFLLTLIIVCIIGFVLASFVGRRLWRLAETTITQVPGVKQIYPYVKQVTDYIFGERRVAFSRVVAVQYPRKGVWSVGFVTGPALEPLRRLDDSYMTIFMPSSPTPLTGYVITVLKADTIDVPITVDQAFRFIISGGVLTPDVALPGLEKINTGPEPTNAADASKG